MFFLIPWHVIRSLKQFESPDY